LNSFLASTTVSQCHEINIVFHLFSSIIFFNAFSILEYTSLIFSQPQYQLSHLKFLQLKVLSCNSGESISIKSSIFCTSIHFSFAKGETVSIHLSSGEEKIASISTSLYFSFNNSDCFFQS